MPDTPAVISRYFHAADAADIDALIACFTPDATVVDDGERHRGRAAIAAWREAVAAKYSYTTTVTGSELVDDDEYRAYVRVEGDFPGGVADLTFRFRLSGDLIADLVIAG